MLLLRYVKWQQIPIDINVFLQHPTHSDPENEGKGKLVNPYLTTRHKIVIFMHTLKLIYSISTKTYIWHKEIS